MTPEQQTKLEAIKAALRQHIEEAEKATPGAWDYYWGWDLIFQAGNRSVQIADCLLSEETRKSEQVRDDMAFISRARTMSPLACKMALFAIETMEYDKQEGNAGAYNDLVSMLSIWEGGQP